MIVVPISFDLNGSESVLVTSQVSLFASDGLPVTLRLCLQTASGGIIPLPGGLSGQSIPNGTSRSWTLSTTIAAGAVSPGQYEIGLCGQANGPTTNAGSSTSGLLFQG